MALKMIKEEKPSPHFHEISGRMLRAAESIEDQRLARELKEFLAAYSGNDQKLPRSAHELLKAQMLGRRVLMGTKDYGLVYDWYSIFKNPYGEDIDQNLEYYVRSIREGAKALRWIRGHDIVLECGCGAASLGFELARYNGRWIASDILYPPSFDKLTEIFSPGSCFEFSVIDGITLEGVQDSSIEVVISRSFFEHLLPEDALTHILVGYRVLKPGGKLIITCPAGVGPPSDITNRFPEYDTAQGLHIKEYRITEMAQMLKGAGFSYVSSWFIRTRFIGFLPLFVQRRNRLPVGVAAALESAAARTWPMLRKSSLGSKFWWKFWGRLGAASIMVIAQKSLPNHI